MKCCFYLNVSVAGGVWASRKHPLTPYIYIYILFVCIKSDFEKVVYKNIYCTM